MLIALIKSVSIDVFFVDLIHLNPCLERRGLAVCILVEETSELFRDAVLKLIQLINELCNFSVKR